MSGVWRDECVKVSRFSFVVCNVKLYVVKRWVRIQVLRSELHYTDSPVQNKFCVPKTGIILELQTHNVCESGLDPIDCKSSLTFTSGSLNITLTVIYNTFIGLTTIQFLFARDPVLVHGCCSSLPVSRYLPQTRQQFSPSSQRSLLDFCSPL